MKQAKRRAILCVIGCAAYIWLTAILVMFGLHLSAFFALLCGLICATENFIFGRQYERERQKAMRLGISEPHKAADTACEYCGCREFTVVAGRMVCICCGKVMENIEKEQ